MIVPLFGYLGKAQKNNAEIRGCSSEKGFELEFIADHQTISFATSKHIKEDDLAITLKNDCSLKNWRFWINISIFLLIGFSVKQLYQPTGTQMVMLGAALVIVALWVGALVGLFLVFKQKELREWHALEHKSSVLWDAGLEPTEENLNRCPKLLIYCGGGWLVLALIFITTLYFSIARAVGFLAISEILLSITNMLLMGSLLVIAAITMGFRHYKIVAILLMLLAAVPICITALFARCVLKNPAPEKVRRTAEELKKFIENQKIA